MSTLESTFQSYLVQAINAPGRSTRVWRQQPTGKRGGELVHGAPKGAADLSGVVAPEGWRLEVEMKGHRTPVTPAQKRWAEFIRARGGLYVVIRYDERRSMGDNVLDAIEVIDAEVAARRVQAIPIEQGRSSVL